jgi:hypothetical protein
MSKIRNLDYSFSHYIQEMCMIIAHLLKFLTNVKVDLRNSVMIGSLTSGGSSAHLPGRGLSRLILPLAFGHVGSGHCV